MWHRKINFDGNIKTYLKSVETFRLIAPAMKDGCGYRLFCYNLEGKTGICFQEEIRKSGGILWSGGKCHLYLVESQTSLIQSANEPTICDTPKPESPIRSVIEEKESRILETNNYDPEE